MRYVIHVDMDAFFASMEQLVNPSLRGKPVIVGGVPGTRSTVSTASYEARVFGVHSGMSIAEAHRLCPQGVFLPGSTTLYLYTSARLLKELEQFSPRVEPASIDEAYLEVDSENPLATGQEIQSHLEAKLELTASLGISDSKYLAKVCSSFQKPRGISILMRAEVESKLWPRPLSTLYGVGAKTESRLQALGYKTIGDLARTPEGLLERQIGVVGAGLRRNARGEDRLRVTPPEEAPDAKSIGHEHTLEEDVYDRTHLEAMLCYLTQKVGRRARKSQMAGRRVVLKLRDRHFHTITHGRLVQRPLDIDDEIFSVGRELLGETRIWVKGVRLIGVSLQRLVRTDSSKQLVLDFDPRRSRATPVVDQIKSKYGEHAIGPARVLEAVRNPRAVRPRPSFFRPRGEPDAVE